MEQINRMRALLNTNVRSYNPSQRTNANALELDKLMGMYFRMKTCNNQ